MLKSLAFESIRFQSRASVRPEPDILCVIEQDEIVAFELVELCIEEIAKTTSDMIKSRLGGSSCMWVGDPTKNIVRNKLEKSYLSNYPIELVCYTNGRTGSTDSSIIQDIREVTDSRGLGQFRRIWLLGEHVCEVVCE